MSRYLSVRVEVAVADQTDAELRAMGDRIAADVRVQLEDLDDIVQVVHAATVIRKARP